MFSMRANMPQLRVLIASASAERRRHVSEIVRSAGLRAVGFIREIEQLVQRTRTSAPEVLLIDADLLQTVKHQRVCLADLRAVHALRVLVFGHQVNSQLLAQWKRDGVLGALHVTDAVNDESAARSLWELLEAASVSTTSPFVVEPAMSVPETRRRTLSPGSVVIGSSTGGPMALMALLKVLPAGFPLPVAVVQHMPAGFTRMLAERLNAECPLHVTEAADGMAFHAGTVFIAPGGFHMQIEGSPRAPRITLNTQKPENSCRPAVDVLFRSSAKVYGGHQHAIVLTGMGRDGLIGATELHRLGARIVAQDAASSTVWGMPGAIAQAGLADDVLPPAEIASNLLRCV